jgi:gamma-glutamyltranspeptidase
MTVLAIPAVGWSKSAGLVGISQPTEEPRVCVEDGFSPTLLEGLRERGHEPVAVDDYNQFGSCQAIWRLGDGYLAAGDPRRDGQAVGF